jgi:predicted nucleic acid-binding protein
VSVGDVEITRATELEALGFGAYDALHLACAESAQAQVFLSTDDGLLRLAERHKTDLRTIVRNPLKWLEEEWAQ